MYEFNSLDDWIQVDKEIYTAIRAVRNFGHKIQLSIMHKNIAKSVTALSKADIDRRKFGRSPIYDEQLAKVQQELQELQQWLTFATLLD